MDAKTLVCVTRVEMIIYLRIHINFLTKARMFHLKGSSTNTYVVIKTYF